MSVDYKEDQRERERLMRPRPAELKICNRYGQTVSRKAVPGWLGREGDLVHVACWRRPKRYEGRRTRGQR